MLQVLEVDDVEVVDTEKAEGSQEVFKFFEVARQELSFASQHVNPCIAAI